MAYTSGTAANYTDLLARLATFAAANGWTVLEQAADRVYMKGAGLTGTDEIYAGIRTYEDAPNGRYNWQLFGAWAYRAGRAFEAMPMSSSGTTIPCSYLWNDGIPYWFVATPRRLMGFAKVTTTYTCFHLGLLNPAGTDAQYPYPLLIGGCGDSPARNYSDTGNNAAWWGGPVVNNRVGVLSTPGGTWMQLSAITSDSYLGVIIPRIGMKSVTLDGLDGSYLIEPLYVVRRSFRDCYGAIDGLFWVTGYNNAAENIITVAGKTYMVFPDVYRTAKDSYCCMRLD